MEILSYPVGLLIGLFPIAVELGPSRAPAHLLLDSRPVCEITSRSPGCMVTSGRTRACTCSSSSAPTWPDTSPSACAAGSTGRGSTRRCWLRAPAMRRAGSACSRCPGLTPASSTRSASFCCSTARPSTAAGTACPGASLEGSEAAGPGRDAEFPDGTRATYTRTLFAFYPEEAQAALQAVPILPPTDSGSTRFWPSVCGARDPVRTVEQTEPDITFVLAPHVFDGVPGILQKAPSVPGTHPSRFPLRRPARER